MEIVEAKIDHLNDAAKLFDGYRVFYRQESDIEGAKQFLIERFKNKDSIIYLAYKGHKPVGFTQLFPLFSSVSMEPMLLLNDLYIVQDERNQGIGEALITRAKKLCKDTNQKGMGIQTETSNRAQELYQRLGFKIDPDLHLFWKCD